MKTDDRREGWLAGFHAEHANSTRTAETKTQTRIRRLASRVRMESTSRINKDPGAVWVSIVTIIRTPDLGASR